MTLGDLERSQIIPLIDETRQLIRTGKIVAQVTSATIATAAIAAGLGVGIAGYAVYDWVNESSMLEDIKKWIERKKQNVQSTLTGDGPATHGNTNIFGLPGWGLWEGVL